MRYEFSVQMVENKAASNREGRTVYREAAVLDAKGKPEIDPATNLPRMAPVSREMVEVIIPADRNASWFGDVNLYRAQLQREVRDSGVNPQTMMLAQMNLDRFNKAYEAFKNNTGLALEGTPLNEMEGLSGSMRKRLLENHVGTVEELAALSDQQCQNLGMGFVRFRTVAQALLKSRQGGDVSALASQLQTQAEEIARNNAKHDEERQKLLERIAALEAAKSEEPVAEAPPPPLRATLSAQPVVQG